MTFSSFMGCLPSKFRAEYSQKVSRYYEREITPEDLTFLQLSEDNLRDSRQIQFSVSALDGDVIRIDCGSTVKEFRLSPGETAEIAIIVSNTQ